MDGRGGTNFTPLIELATAMMISGSSPCVRGAGQFEDGQPIKVVFDISHRRLIFDTAGRVTKRRVQAILP